MSAKTVEEIVLQRDIFDKNLLDTHTVTYLNARWSESGDSTHLPKCSSSRNSTFSDLPRRLDKNNLIFL